MNENHVQNGTRTFSTLPNLIIIGIYLFAQFQIWSIELL